jgi:SIR2-like domain
VQVIVTTNFDRLLEMALVAAGVQPQVISSPAHAAGATPLAHSRCSIIKVHGDYLSPDLKNTVAELSTYDPSIDRLLDEVLDQYGLVVCGWSGVWDPALRNAILRAPGRRYATYWAHRGEPAPEATELIAHRDAIDAPIADADSFFESLTDKVAALAAAVDQRPQTTALAVAQLKRYLPDPTHRIRLHDLVMSEVDHVLAEVTGVALQGDWSANLYSERMEIYERATATLTTLLATGAYFGDSAEADRLWQRALGRLAHRPVEHAGLTALVTMQHYPLTMALYAIGLGAVAAGRVDPFAVVLSQVDVPDPSNRALPVAVKAAAGEILNENAFKQAHPDLRLRKTPASDHLHDVLRPAVSGILPDHDRYDAVFDQVEYLLALAYGTWRDGKWFPVGRSVWRHRESIDEAIAPLRQSLLDAGLFDGSDSKLRELLEAYQQQVDRDPLF